MKNRLAEYIRDVRSGESVVVTDRGEIVAELTPPSSRRRVTGRVTLECRPRLRLSRGEAS